MWWKQHKWKVLAPLLIVAVLVGAFWYGGNAPGARGWTVAANETAQSAPKDNVQEIVKPVQMEKPTVAEPVPEEPIEAEKQEAPASAEEPKEEPTVTALEQPTAPEPTAAPTTSQQQEQEQPTPAQVGERPEMVIDPATGKGT